MIQLINLYVKSASVCIFLEQYSPVGLRTIFSAMTRLLAYALYSGGNEQLNSIKIVFLNLTRLPSFSWTIPDWGDFEKAWSFSHMFSIKVTTKFCLYLKKNLLYLCINSESNSSTKFVLISFTRVQSIGHQR